MQQVLAKELQPYRLDGARSLDISAVAEWREDLRRALDSGSRALHLDLTAVEKIDTACLQVLAAFVLGAREKHIDLVWCGANIALRSAAEDLGLDRLFGIDHE